MELSIPLPSYRGRGAASLRNVLNYSSKVWGNTTPTNYTTTAGAFSRMYIMYAERSSSGWTSSLGVPQLDTTVEAYTEGGLGWAYDPELNVNNDFNISYIRRLRIIMPDGSVHEMRADDGSHNYGTATSPGNGVTYADQFGRSFLSVDGSRLRLEFTHSGNEYHNTLYMPDGSRYVDLVEGHYGSTTYYDVNGNQMIYTVGNGEAYWTDSMGRTIPDPIARGLQSLPPTSGIKTYTYPTISGGVAQDIQLVWEPLSNQQSDLAYLSPVYCDGGATPQIPSDADSMFTTPGGRFAVCGSQYKFNAVVLTAVKLPNETQYSFHYNTFGEIDRIDYPSGGYERFEYAQAAPVAASGDISFDQFNRIVTDRYISEDGTNESEIHWHYEIQKETTLYTSGPYHVKTFAPDGTWSEQLSSDRYYPGITGYGFGEGQIGIPYETRYYDSTNSHNLIRRELVSYTQTGGVAIDGISPEFGAYRDIRPNKEVSMIFDPGSSAALVSMIDTGYDTNGNSDPQYFSSLNPKQVKQYRYLAINASTASSASVTTAAGWFSDSDLVRVTENDYLYDSNYKAKGLVGLIVERRELNPANTAEVFAKSQFVYDETAYFDNNYTTSYWEDPNSNIRGNVTTSRTWDKDANTWIETHTMYDNFGNLRKVWDASGDANRYIETVYSSSSYYAYPTRTIAKGPDPNGVHGTSESSEINRVYDFNTGLITSVTDSNGQTATNEYDLILRPVRTTPPTGGSISETIYNDTPGNIWIKKRQQIDDHNWAEKTVYFDNLGRAVKSRTKDAQGDVMTEIVYDGFGRVEKTSNPYRVDPSGNAAETVYWSKLRYDSIGRVVETYAPAPAGQTGQSLGTVEFGISTLSGLEGAYTIAKDASGRKLRAITSIYGIARVDEATAKGGATDADLGTLANPAQPTYYSYNFKGELTKITQGSQNRYFMYDSLGRLIRIRQPEQTPNTNLATSGNPDNNSWTAGFTYDADGNVLTTTDAKGITITNQYDNAGRTIKRTYSDGTPEVEYFYDGKGLSSTPDFSKGALTRVTSAVSEDRFTNFDNQGRLLESQQLTDGAAYTFGYKYNLSGSLIEQTYPSGRVVRNFLDSDGGLSGVATKASNGLNRIAASDFDYSATGNVKKMKLGNGLWETAQVDPSGQLTQIGLGTTATGNDLFKVDYEYGELGGDGTTVDASKSIGMIAKATTTVPTTNFVQTYKYDELNRLTEAKEKTSSTTNWQQTFGYDRYGNRNSFSQTVNGVALTLDAVNHPTIDSANNRFTTGQGYVYDYNGNIVQDAEGRKFTFNGDDKQTVVKDANDTVIGEYYYDASGARVKKVVPSTGETTVFVYDAGGALAAEYSTQVETQNPQISYLTTDHLGSPRVITDQSGNVTSRRDFMPYGEEIGAGVGARTTSLKYSVSGTDNIRKRFTGYEKDDETGLDFAEVKFMRSFTFSNLVFTNISLIDFPKYFDFVY